MVITSIPREIPHVDSIKVLVVNDGSTDRSAAVAQANGAIVISHRGNQGVGRSLQSALNYAVTHGFDLMVNIDADGQFDPNDIPKLIEPIVSGRADFVSASRFLTKDEIEHMSPIKYWGNQQMNKLINRLSGQTFSDVSCGFRAYSREAMYRLNLQNNFTYTQESFLNLAFQGVAIEQVPIKVRYFADRKSRVASNILQYAFKTSKIIFRTYRDYRPLKFFVSLAGLFFAVGLALEIFLLMWWLIHKQFTPNIWAGFVGAGFLFCGVILVVVGLMADMLCRIRKGQEEILYNLRRGNS